MPPFEYAVVDVFTRSRFGGNPLAVLPDARDLDAETMQQVAREFGFSETTFVLPPADEQHTARVRIFTPRAELPFAGHPNVGTAFVLAELGEVFGRRVGDTMVFEEQAGLVGVTILREDGAVVGAEIAAPGALEVGQEVAVEVVAGCASLAREDVNVTRHAPRVVSVGLPFVVAELVSRAALARARPNLALFAEAEATFPLAGGFSLFLYVREDETGQRCRTRMFAPLDGVVEDPATGSASAALAGYLAALLPGRDGEVGLTFEQGVDMGRPSLLHLRAWKVAGAVERVVVGGNCVPVMRGELYL
jgi:trans-2,3-dihydro-3-hydroxyanthranilate isomerase